MNNLKRNLLTLSAYFIMAMMLPVFVSCDDDDENQVTVSQQDRTFAENATYSNRAEISMGELALTKATNQEVQAYAQQMIDDHTLAQTQLQTIATQHNLNLPTGLRQQDQTMMQQLQGLEGEAFDLAYMQSQVTAHQQAVTIFQDEVDEGDDEDLVSYATTKLPIVQTHLQMAEALVEQLNNQGQ